MRLLLILSLMAAPALAQDRPTKYQAAMDQLLHKTEKLPDSPLQRLDWIAGALQSEKDPFQRYLLRRQKFFDLRSLGRNHEVQEICREAKPLADDFEWRMDCIEITSQTGSERAMIDQMLEVLDKARESQDLTSITEALIRIGWLRSSVGDAAEALSTFNEALAVVPKENVMQRRDIMFSLATNYVIHGDREYIQKGIDLLSDMRDNYRTLFKEDKKIEYNYPLVAKTASYNIGLAYALHLHDYQKALPDLEQAAQPGDPQRIDAMTFAALSAAHIGEIDRAKAFLQQLSHERHENPTIEQYLSCYRGLAARVWDKGSNLKPCLNLKEDTSIEIVLDINKRLVDLKGQPEEMPGLRNFVRMYVEKIEPEYQRRTVKAASRSELARLESEAKLKDEKIALGERIRLLLYVVAGFSLLLLLLLFAVVRGALWIRRQAQDLATQKANLQQVLDHIDEGIVKMDSAGHITSVYSRYAEGLFRQKPDQLSQKDFLKQLGLHGDTLASAIEALHAILGEDAVAWDLNQSHLPSSGNVNGRPFMFYWDPVLEAGHVRELVISLRDASAERALQHEEITRDRLIALVHAGPPGRAFVVDLPTRLPPFFKGTSQEDTARSLRTIHTIKGEARSFGLKNLQHLLHDLEQKHLGSEVDDSVNLLVRIEEEIRSLLDAEALLRSDNSTPVAKDPLMLLVTCLQDAERRLKKAGLQLRLQLNADALELTKAELDALRDVLVHSIANAVDHGYLLPKKRNKKVENPAILLIQLQEHGNEARLSIEDRGVGIDWQALQSLAQEKAWQPKPGRPLTDIVFLDQTSTVSVQEITRTSGRGIGLAAVADAIGRLRGTVELQAGANNQGARLDLVWPRNLG